MADLAQLNVSIGADVAPLTAGLNDAKSQLSNFAGQATGTAGAVNELGTSTQLAAIHAIGFARGLENLAVVGAQGQVSMGGLFEVVRSGAIEFNALQKETGSTVQAFQGLFGALFTTETVIIGVISVVGLLANHFLNAAAATDEYADALKKIDENALKSSESEIAHAQVLLAVARDTSAAMSERINAVSELQKLYPSYLGNLSQEKVLNGDITANVNALTDALINKGLAEAAEKKFAETSAQIYDLIQKRRDAVTALTIAQNNYNEAEKNFASNQSNKDLAFLVGIAKSNLEEAKTDLQGITTLREQADLQQQQFLNDAKTLGEAAGQLFIKPAEQISKNTKTIVESTKVAKNALIDLFSLRSGTMTAPAGPAAPVTALSGDNILKALTDRKNTEALANMKKQVQEITSVARELGHIFDQVFYSLLTTGKISFKQLGESVARFISQIISSIIETTILKAVLGALTGGTSIGIGAAASAALGAIPHAEGGIFTQPTLIGSHLFGEKGPEALVPLNRLSSMIQGMGSNVEVTGSMRLGYNELLIAFSRANKYAGRNYGNFSNG